MANNKLCKICTYILKQQINVVSIALVVSVVISVKVTSAKPGSVPKYLQLKFTGSMSVSILW